MGDHQSPRTKSEPEIPLSYGLYAYPPPLHHSMSYDDLAPPAARTRRRALQPALDTSDLIMHPEQEKHKRPRTGSNKLGSGRGSMQPATQAIPADEITYTPTTHRISKAKKGKKVHNCTFPGCPKVFTRAEHRRRHEANHNAHPAYQCQVEGCKKPFQRADLLTRHMERQHHMPMDSSSTRSGRSRGSMSEISSPPMGGHSMPRSAQQYPTSGVALGLGAGSFKPSNERNMHDTSYRTHSVPPSLHDRLASQPIGTAPCGLLPEVVYSLSPTGDSFYSSSDSCYSPSSDFLQAPRALPPHFAYGHEVLQRPHSAFETSYPSIETSPMSVGPPTPVSGAPWPHAFDPTALAFIPETHCLPHAHYAQPTTTSSWTGAPNVAFQCTTMPPQSGWQ